MYGLDLIAQMPTYGSGILVQLRKTKYTSIIILLSVQLHCASVELTTGCDHCVAVTLSIWLSNADGLEHREVLFFGILQLSLLLQWQKAKKMGGILAADLLSCINYRVSLHKSP